MPSLEKYVTDVKKPGLGILPLTQVLPESMLV
jgi:hypothetical protein